MKTTADTLATKLEAIVGRQAVQEDPGVLAAHAVDGVVPSVRVAPQDAAQIGDVLKVCAEERAAVVPWGGGTSMRMGNRPARADVVLSLERLNALVEHDDANLTATVQAGVRLGVFQQMLARGNQFLAIDPPRPAEATIGGIVAANTNGPRRMHYGGVRDQVIGMKTVLATGEEVKSGGKVVKNVAGYDMCKLFTGSLGTLGVITEATFRMAPVPERSMSVLASGTGTKALEMSEQLRASQLLPSAITLVNRQAADALLKGSGIREQGSGWQVLIWVEGFEEAVERHLSDLQALVKNAGLVSAVMEGPSHHTIWTSVCDFGSGTPHTMLRLTVPVGLVAEAVSSIDGWFSDSEIVAHAGSGTIWISAGERNSIDSFTRLLTLASSLRGHVIIASASPQVKKAVDVWGSPPPGLSIMADIKRQFDPAGIMNPGRFVARL